MAAELEFISRHGKPTVVNGYIQSVLALSMAFASTVLFEVRAQTNDAPKWYQGSVGDFKDTMVYQALSDFGGKHYEAHIYGRDLDGVPKWRQGRELPITVSKLVADATSAFRKHLPQFNQFKMTSVNVIHLPAVDDWIVNVEFNGTDFATFSAGAFEEKKINVLVLLDGRTVTATETDK